MRLICFPYAGGSASVYRNLQGLLPGIDVCAVELPGRGARMMEPAHASMDSLINTLLGELRLAFGRPFAMLGHSMGAAIAFELACRLPSDVRPNLRHLFLSARNAPGYPHHRQLLHGLDDHAFVQELRLLGGTPKEVFDDLDLMAIVMPMLRADFSLVEKYHPPTHRTVAIGITCFAGSEDKGRHDG
jgi:medium-chain acyl-[acyl-carrier-protein] hydrolase